MVAAPEHLHHVLAAARVAWGPCVAHVAHVAHEQQVGLGALHGKLGDDLVPFGENGRQPHQRPAALRAPGPVPPRVRRPARARRGNLRIAMRHTGIPSRLTRWSVASGPWLLEVGHLHCPVYVA
ncbi:hypothetical protein [Actinomadura sp. J1-007]|uniref:hypothetical protein n=1 Tax=Actinomadura sp. J1-007 TaxID=2661913 RepID=UPI0028158735|nr:hypothetical protein [Actinomadura sp. J1-007]